MLNYFYTFIAKKKTTNFNYLDLYLNIYLNKIYNDYGEVRFLSKVNLINLDIDNECVIEKGSIELNDHLNVKRKCILYNLDLNENEGMIEEFKKKISENNGVFISYNGITGRLEWDYI